MEYIWFGIDQGKIWVEIYFFKDGKLLSLWREGKLHFPPPYQTIIQHKQMKIGKKKKVTFLVKKKENRSIIVFFSGK